MVMVACTDILKIVHGGEVKADGEVGGADIGGGGGGDLC